MEIFRSNRSNVLRLYVVRDQAYMVLKRSEVLSRYLPVREIKKDSPRVSVSVAEVTVPLTVLPGFREEISAAGLI